MLPTLHYVTVLLFFLQSVRPVENSSYPLIVNFGVSLHQIVDVDEKNQILTTNCWLTQVNFT